MPNVLTFGADQFLVAQEAALDGATDLVVVDDMTDPFKDDFNANVERLQKFFAEQTPVIQQYWDENHVPGYGTRLKPWLGRIQMKGIQPHIDLPIYAGYIVSANLSTQDRFFYAERQTIHGLFENGVAADSSIFRKFNNKIMDTTIPEEDWTRLKPGAVALFGAMPHIAVHAAEGTTFDAMLYAWAARSDEE